ncbi:MAG: hypothetical protein IT376_05340 [Polyangiaceae bacterium]|nr:hypothetical protein [Polyangiaceae bacterium]
MTDFHRLLETLIRGEVDFIVIGGFAATAHGSALVTVDLDIVYGRAPENLVRLAAALEPLSPYLRGAPPGLPFQFDSDTLARSLSFRRVTTAGDVDVLGEASGGGTYEALLPRSEVREVLGLPCRFVHLATPIHLKRAACRPNDLERIAELEALHEEERGAAR